MCLWTCTKCYDEVPREEVWHCMRMSGVTENSTRQTLYDDSTTLVRCAVGVTERFDVKVGLHQWSALSPCLFAVVMDRMTDEIREEAPYTLFMPRPCSTVCEAWRASTRSIT